MMFRFLAIPTLLSGAVLLAGCTLETEEVGSKQKESGITVTYDGRSPAAQTAPSQAPQEKAKTPPVSPPQKNDTVTQPMSPKKSYAAPPTLAIDATKAYTATLRTDLGDIVVALDTKATPITANNFVFLAREKFYDNTIFHRVMSGFMIQGGDPQGTGMGGPGYAFPDEPVVKEYKRGTVAMANSGKDTNGSQFFIMHADYPLPKNYVIFGEVTSGMDVVDKIATAEVTVGQSGERSTPVTPITVRTVEVAETAAGS